MKIKSLTLRGFKSFADETEVELHEGLTAIVGPNGCGKSNISDALRWVLGEQRPTAIRGSRMEEAIFGGTAERRPIHRAEVRLTLSNEDRTLPVPYSEVVIGRTVYRGGESDYSLNGADCRLKDIQDLCRDTGLGANAYAIIENRMIDAILSDRAEERRGLFEEAAEVGRYKDRRKTANRRLEQAETDLQRLDDVLGEVQSKVRSLAQQRGRAKRYLELRDRRLRLEIALADARLSSARERAEEAEAELERLRESRPAEEARLQTAETRAERLRVEIAERERERSAAAKELEETRRRLEERERGRLVAAERAAAAEERLASIAEELERLRARREELEAEIERARRAAEAEEAALGEVREREAALREEVERSAAERAEAVREREDARERLEALAREIGGLEAERTSAAERIEERREELERRRPALGELERRERESAEALRRAREEEREAAEEAERAVGRLEAARAEAEERRAGLREVRERVASLEGDLSAARARAASLSGFLASDAGLPPAVAELLEAEVAGVEGVLADGVRAESEHARAVEAHLGAYLQAVLVRDWRAVAAVRDWLRAREGDGGLLVLPLDPGPAPPPEVSDDGGPYLLDLVEAEGPGAAWIRALLAGVRWRPDAKMSPAPGPWAGPGGEGQDPRGAVRLGRPGPGRGALTRRAELAGLRDRIDALGEDLEAGRGEAESLESELAAARETADRAEAAAREAARARRQAEGHRETAEERLERIRREREETARRVAELEASLEEARDRAETGDDRLERLRSERAGAEEEAARARARADEVVEAWEARRTELHDVQLRSARREADRDAARERLARARAALREVEARVERLEGDRREQEEAKEAGRRAAESGEEEVVALLEARRGLEARLREAEARLEDRRSALEAKEAELREARRVEREHTERRHELELAISELRARESGIRERLEGEWDAPLEELRDRVEPPEEGGAEAWERELAGVRRKLQRIGAVNLLAEEEYEEERERLDFLMDQREDLIEARDDLRDSIRRINRKASESFVETFEQVREHFQRTFTTLFEGGQCDLWLADEEEPLDSPIEISASPRGKRTQRIHLLSGGERALTALALLFAIYLAKPSPFCLLDEVDAPLDETNVLRFVGMLERFKADTQFIVITHNPRTIEAADWIYGVTMQEPGVSSLVGVRFEDAVDQVA